MVAINVAGGTRAGWRIVKPKPRDWLCRCFNTTLADRDRGKEYRHPGYLARCPDCGARRP